MYKNPFANMTIRCRVFVILWYHVTVCEVSEMKIDRLIGIIMILLQKDKATAPELAERFEVSRRTINRDIEDICKAGIPLVTTRGSGGGISILDSYKPAFPAEHLRPAKCLRAHCSLTITFRPIPFT